MTQSRRATGSTLTLTAPYARATSGLGALVGAIFGVSCDTVANGEEGQFETEGVHELDKTSAQAHVAGDLAFWNAATKLVDNDPTTGKCIGVILEAAANPSATTKVKLIPGFSVLVEGKQATIAAVATADADATYGAPEQNLINELKTQVNLVIAALKTAGIVTA